MLKQIILIFNSFVFLLYSLLFNEPAIIGNFPKAVKPGSEFTAEITVKKGSVTGFSKLQLEVPKGLTIKELENQGSIFTFDSGIAKFIWTSTPEQEEFTVKFTVAVAPSQSGSSTIKAKYSFVTDNNKQVIEMTPADINVSSDAPDAVLATNTTATNTDVAVTTNNTNSNTTSTTSNPTTNQTANTNVVEPTTSQTAISSNSSTDAKTIACKRTITNGTNANEYNVEIRLNKPGVTGFAKYQEIVPEGYTARIDKSSGCDFSFSDKKAKFVWVSVPEEEVVIVSYILEKPASASSNDVLTGEFSYLEDNKTKKVKSSSDAIAITPVNNTLAVNTTTTNSVSNSTNTSNNNVATTNNTTSNNNTASNNTVSNTKTNTQTTAQNPPISKNNGSISYAVQIGAFRGSVSSESLANRYGIGETVRSEMVDGLNKFLVGNFPEYRSARDHRENVKGKGVYGAFVVAYNSSQRITVQEALMISNQQWFK